MRNCRTEEGCDTEKFSSPIQLIETAGLTINRDYKPIVESIGLNDFDPIWRFQEGNTVKDIRPRSVIRINVPGQDRERIFYLKRHRPEFMGFRCLLRLIFPNQTFSQGKIEFKNICDFRKKALATAAPVAAGEKWLPFPWMGSFLITEDFAPYVSLEKRLRDAPEFFMGTDGDLRKKAMLREVATLARKMHQSGFNHLDFNATHILLLYEPESNIPKTALFDLQRVDRKKIFKFRWMIKSLARLNYTLPEDIFTAEDRIYMMQSYKGKKDLNVFDMFQWFWIKRKTARIQEHIRKKRIRASKR
jgi:heptose I phosphotransferase